MNTYGLTQNDLMFAQKKIDAQKSYLSNNTFVTQNGQVKSFMDVSFSANISQRYYAQLSNKINTMADYALLQGLHPVFLTVTIDGFFRDLLVGDYTRWNKKSEEQKENYLTHIPESEIYGFIRSRIFNQLPLSIKDLYNVLNYQWYRYSSSYPFKKLKKEGLKFVYLKAVEPHKDGVPHFHVLLWVPQNYFSIFQTAFRVYFPAPQNHKLFFEGNKGDTQGFQTLIYNPVGYIMKYATKSFIDISNGADIDYLQAWYIKNKIRRITTSQTTIPQWIYRKVAIIEPSWLYLTELKDANLCEWSFKEDYFIFIQEDTGRTLQYDRGVLTLSYLNEGITVQTFGTKKSYFIAKRLEYEKVPSKCVRSVLSPIIPIITPTGEYVMNRKSLEIHSLLPKIPKPLNMKDVQLMSYYQSLDLQTVSYSHYLHTRQVCVERKLIDIEYGDYEPYFYEQPLYNNYEESDYVF